MKVFVFPDGFSSNANRVEFMLHEKGIEYERVVLDPFKGEHKSETFLKHNPRGQVPTLVDGDLVVVESVAICQYLDKFYPDPPMMPSDKKAYTEALVRIHQYSNKLADRVSAVVFPGLIQHKPKEELTKQIDTLNAELKEWNGYLEGRKYFAGSEFSMADICVLPVAIQVDMMGVNWQLYPNLASWFERVRSRDAIKRAWPKVHGDETKRVKLLNQ